MEQTDFSTPNLAVNILPPVERESAEVLNAIFAGLPDACYLFDTERHLSRINGPAAELEKAEAETLLGRRCCEMFWRVEGASWCVVERALAEGGKVEVEIAARENSERAMLITVLPIRDAENTLTGSVLVVARDISELRRAEAEAFEQKAFLASLADVMPDEIYSLDLQGQIIWMNERADAANGQMPTALYGRHFNDLVAKESKEATETNIKRALDGEDARGEIQAVREDGEARFVEAHLAPRWKDGAVAGVMVFLRDLTERKRTHERMAQSDKLRAVGELAAGVAHNINNSLTVIQGRAQLLQRRATDEATAKSLDIIINAVSDGTQTLRRILDFARRETTKQFVPVDLTELISSSVEIARPKWQRKAATRRGQIEVKVETRGPVFVIGEKAELREVVLNLLFNAVDAMPEGGEIETGTRAELDSACFWVADTGTGMSPETLARIFEPFYTTKGEGGTGLGLSASHGIITRHNGQIMVVSEPGLGTRFEIRLPLYEGKPLSGGKL